MISAAHSALLCAVALLAWTWLSEATSFQRHWESPAAAATLRKYIRATESELKRLALGEVLTRTLDAPDGREITTFGVIKVRCTAETFVARLKDIERFKASEYVMQIGRFQTTPSVQDVRPLAFDPEERVALRACRPGSCSIRLPAATIERLHREIPWGAPAEAEVAALLLQQFLADQARAYVSGGSAALADYADRAGTIPRAAAFRLLLRPSAFLAESQPEMFAWLDTFPKGQLAGAESFLYWSREKFGLKPVVSITHAVVMRREGAVAFGAKQVFASHYFESSLGLSVFISTPGTDDGYMTYLNRSRVDTLRGLFAGLARVIAARRARDGLDRMLIDVKRKLEAPDAPK